MYKLLAISLLLLSSSALAADTPATNAQVSENAQPQVRVSVSQGASASLFNVGAVITDRRTGNVLAKPTMSIEAGAWAQAEVGATGTSGLTSVAFSVTVDPTGQHAAYFAEIRRADGKVDSESGTMRIAQ